jgi:hypothetical protein
MSESTIRQKIYEIVSSVPGIGRVYDYERWAADWGQFINLFKDSSGRILGWEISRVSAEAKYDDNAEEVTEHRYIVRGYMGLSDSDASEKSFHSLIEDIRNTFRFNFTLDENAEWAGPVSLQVADVRTFGPVLCHYCELVLPVRELISQ